MTKAMVLSLLCLFTGFWSSTDTVVTHHPTVSTRISTPIVLQDGGDVPPLGDDLTYLGFYRSAVCRVELPGGGHGTGFGVGRNGDWTFVMTARHVVDGFSEFAPFNLRFTKKGRDLVEKGFIRALSASHDLAILMVKNSELEILDLEGADYAPERDPKSFTYDLVSAIGYPGDLYPAITSLGFIYDIDSEHYLHSSGSWFGNSGGPLVRFFNGKVVGVTVMIAVYDGFERTNHLYAVKIKDVHDFIKEANGASK